MSSIQIQEHRVTIYPTDKLIYRSIHVPPSKSETVRALIFASLAKGTSTIYNPLVSRDIEYLKKACIQLGARFYEKTSRECRIKGMGRDVLSLSKVEIDAGNSGLIFRFFTALLALGKFPYYITGDRSIREHRPIYPLIQALHQLGCSIKMNYHEKGVEFPLHLQGPIHSGTVCIDGQDSQPVSALLMALSLIPGKSEVEVTNPGEIAWVNLTLTWLRKMGVEIYHNSYTYYSIEGIKEFPPFIHNIYGDFSSASFIISAALITRSDISLEGLSLSDSQGDRDLITLLIRMGASIEWKEDSSLLVKGSISTLRGGDFDINGVIDALPILCVIACFSQKPVLLFNAAIARKKESDRIASITQELKKMGANMEEFKDAVRITPSVLEGGVSLSGHMDHRIIMSLSIASLGSKKKCTISGVDWVSKTFPSFFCVLEQLGVDVRIERD